MTVYVLQHSHSVGEDRDEAKLIGVYSTREQAELAIGRLKKMPGFRDHPEGFNIDAYTLDQDSWQEGFVTILPGEISSK